MLLKCPECELQVSDKAISCPHCGYPISKANAKKPPSKKKRRLPNGFGRITEIKNQNLRNPYRAMYSVGKNENGRPIGKILGYYKTYNEAYTALVEYNKNPYDLDKRMLVSELYEKWTDEYFKTLKSDSSTRTITSAWAYCHTLYHFPVREIKAHHIKGCIEDGYITLDNGKRRNASPNTKMRMKSLWNLMLDYAMEYEIIDKNYARLFEISDNIISESEDMKRSHIPFTKEEMEILWKNVDTPYVDFILIQCYMGWRPQELGLLKVANVDIKNMYIQGGMKTKVGINRLVPIHERIQPLIARQYEYAIKIDSPYLLNCTDSKKAFLSYDKYKKRFDKIRDELKLNPDHKPHDPRKHFVTMAKKYNLNDYAIKKIIGHEISDITERVYTERDPDWLVHEIEKIKD